MREDVLRELPSSLEAEQALISSMINIPSKIQEVEDILSVDDFYWDRHKQIYKNIKELSRRDSEVDLVTLLEEIKNNGDIKSCGGISYISDIAGSGFYGANVEGYIKIIKEKSDRRKLIKTGRELIGKCYDGEDLDNLIGFVEDNMYKVSNSKDSSEIVDISQAVNDVLTRIEQNYQNGGKILGISTGYEELDKTISGLQKGDFIITAARPSMGKTAFALNIGQYASRESSVAIFSLEMTRDQLMERLLAAKCLVDFSAIKTGKLTDEQFLKIANASTDLSNRKIFIDDKATSLADIKAKCRNLKVKKGLDVVIIDYLQLIESTEKSYSREQEIAKISRELKKMAKKLDVTIIALAQLSRAPEARADRRPILSDLRESGSIEQDADIILMLYRDEYYNKESEDKNIAEVIVGKNRNGEVKSIKLGWLGNYQRFASLDRR